MYDESSDGFVTNFNVPGQDAGETNGLYAGVTDNLNGTGLDYIAANPGDDVLANASSTINSLGKVVQTAIQTKANTDIAQARANAAVRAAQKPTLSQQWAALSPFEKIGFIATILGIAVIIKGHQL